MNIRQKQLKFYCTKDWKLIPLHWVVEGGCTCKKSDCRSQGKHPMLPHGLKEASSDWDTVRKWDKRWPQANWGLRTGTKEGGGSGIFAVDVDVKSGGLETWDLLREEHPEPIETITVDPTGGGGMHIWFNQPDGTPIRSKASVIGKGIDHRGDDGYIVIPPSRTTGAYKFSFKPGDVELQEIPGWIVSTLNGKPKEVSQKGKVPAGERNRALVETAGRVRNTGMSQEEMINTLLQVRDTQLEVGDHPVTDEEVIAIANWSTGLDQSLRRTDLGNAKRFVRDHGHKTRYSPNWDQWLVWDGARWKRDDTAELWRLAYLTVQNIYIEGGMTQDEGQREKIIKWGLSSESRHRVSAMLHLAGPLVAIRPEDLDTHDMLLNCENGTVNLKTGELQEHNQEDLITKLIPTYYDPDARCPKWEESLKLWTGGDGELQYFLQVAVGYMLTGIVDEDVFFILHGRGANGKTTFLELLQWLMNDYSIKVSADSLMNYRFKGEARPDIAALAGARLAVASELGESRQFNEPLLKDASGGDLITARYLHSNPFTFKPTHKLFLYGNHLPKITGTDEGIWRRIREIPFRVTIPENKKEARSELQKAYAEEAAGILTWAINGCLFWQNEGLPKSTAVESATKAYRSDQDLLQLFLDEKAVLHPDAAVDKALMFSVWRDWCKESAEEDGFRKTKKWFSRQLTQRYGVKIGGHANKNYTGIRLGDAQSTEVVKEEKVP